MNDLQATDELRLIRARLDGIEHTQEILVRARKDEIWKSLASEFEKTPLLAQVYVLVDGLRTQNDIVAALSVKGLVAPNNKATVSRVLAALRDDLGLIQVIPSAKSQVHVHSPVARILNLPRKVQRWLDEQAKNGRPTD
jgi:hypothetical protein